MTEQNQFADDGEDGETEAVHAPRKDPDPPTGSRAQPIAWLFGIGVVLVLTLGFLVAWGLGMIDLPG